VGFALASQHQLFMRPASPTRRGLPPDFFWVTFEKSGAKF